MTVLQTVPLTTWARRLTGAMIPDAKVTAEGLYT